MHAIYLQCLWRPLEGAVHTAALGVPRSCDRSAETLRSLAPKPLCFILKKVLKYITNILWTITLVIYFEIQMYDDGGHGLVLAVRDLFLFGLSLVNRWKHFSLPTGGVLESSFQEHTHYPVANRHLPSLRLQRRV